jgi:hypothetical protein
LAWGAILVVLAGIFAGGLLVGTSDSLFFFVVYVVIDNYVPGTESVRQILTAFIGAVSYAVAIGCAWLVVKGRVARRAAAPWFIAVVAAGFIFGLPHLSDIVSSGPSLVDLEPYYYGYNSLTLGYWLAQSLLAATACAGWFRLRGRPNKAFAVLPVALATAFLGQLIVSGMRASSLFYEILSALPGTLGYYTIYGLVTGLTLGLCYLITVVPVAALGAVVAPTASATAGAVGPSGAAPGFGPQPGYQPSSQYETASPSDTGSFGWVVMGLFAPWVGLVLWLVWQRDRPRNSRQARNGFIVGMIVNTIVVILEIFYILFSVG